MNKKLKKKLHDIIHSIPFELLVIFCIISSVSLLIIDAAYNFTPSVKIIIDYIEFVLNIFFIIEYSLRISITHNKFVFFKNNIIDFIALLPVLRLFRLVRIIRLVRIVKIVSLNRWSKAISEKSKFLSEGLNEKFIECIIIIFILITVLLVGSIGILIFEKGANEQFKSFSDAVWWAVVTLTTVGYGDKFPVTVGGRVLAVFFMILGLSFFALITGFISSFIIERYKKEANSGMDILGIKDHIIICGWNQNAETIFKELRQLFKDEIKSYVVIGEEKPDYFFDEGSYFIKGDFSKKETLHKAQIEYAQAVILLADTQSGRTGQDIDARTILTALAIDKINPKLYVCAELSSSDNVEHIANAGVNEYIISANYTGNLLAHSVKHPGIARVYNELLKSTEGSQIYKTKTPKKFEGKSFKECAVSLLEDSQGILIGLERKNNYYINPKDETILNEDTLVYINHSALEFV